MRPLQLHQTSCDEVQALRLLSHIPQMLEVARVMTRPSAVRWNGRDVIARCRRRGTAGDEELWLQTIRYMVENGLLQTASRLPSVAALTRSHLQVTFSGQCLQFQVLGIRRKYPAQTARSIRRGRGLWPCCRPRDRVLLLRSMWVLYQCWQCEQGKRSFYDISIDPTRIAPRDAQSS